MGTSSDCKNLAASVASGTGDFDAAIAASGFDDTGSGLAAESGGLTSGFSGCGAVGSGAALRSGWTAAGRGVGIGCGLVWGGVETGGVGVALGTADFCGGRATSITGRCGAGSIVIKIVSCRA